MELFHKVSIECSRLTTRRYSTSFSLGVRSLSQEFRDPIYAIYGFVRFADEIVDTFHDHDKEKLFAKFRADTYTALEERISLNPILHSFQRAVHEFGITREQIDTFLASMEMDLHKSVYMDEAQLKEYVLGSAEVVGLMCLKVFTHGNDEEYLRLKPYAMKLGSAFQKINFLRDLNADFLDLGRTYFPNVDMNNFDLTAKTRIEKEIQEEFDEALIGIRMLPTGARFGVYLAYMYYLKLFKKIQNIPPARILEERIRIPNSRKLALLARSYMQNSFNLL